MMKKNRPTLFSANEQQMILKACSYPVVLPWQRQTHHLNYQDIIVHSSKWCLVKFGDPGISSFRLLFYANSRKLARSTGSERRSRDRQTADEWRSRDRRPQLWPTIAASHLIRSLPIAATSLTARRSRQLSWIRIKQQTRDCSKSKKWQMWYRYQKLCSATLN